MVVQSLQSTKGSNGYDVQCGLKLGHVQVEVAQRADQYVPFPDIIVWKHNRKCSRCDFHPNCMNVNSAAGEAAPHLDLMAKSIYI